MSFKKIALAVLAAAAVVPAMAQSAANVNPDTLKRAEVQADLDPTQTSEYRQYQALRSGPQFAAAVQAHLGGNTALAGQPETAGTAE
jgi:Ni/Co efflux regulator RcnB